MSTDPGEAGIFYIRHPDEATGRITSMTLKHPPVVTGDGRSTLRALILADDRAGRVPHALPGTAGATGWTSVPAAGRDGAAGVRRQPLQRLDLPDGTGAGDPGADRRDRARWPRSMPDFISAGSMCGSARWRRCGGAQGLAGHRDQRHGIRGDAYLGPAAPVCWMPGGRSSFIMARHSASARPIASAALRRPGCGRCTATGGSSGG